MDLNIKYLLPFEFSDINVKVTCLVPPSETAGEVEVVLTLCGQKATSSYIYEGILLFSKLFLIFFTTGTLQMMKAVSPKTARITETILHLLILHCLPFLQLQYLAQQ